MVLEPSESKKDKIKISLLDREQYDNFQLQFHYTTDAYYQVVCASDAIFSVKLEKKSFSKPIQKSFVGHLYADYLENPTAYALIISDRQVGYLEIDREKWHNRLRITELLILDEVRNQGYGTLLIEHAKNIAEEEGFREIILETQSCNIKAIDFYLKNGFQVTGIDLSAYSNDDAAKNEVRLEMSFKILDQVLD